MAVTIQLEKRGRQLADWPTKLQHFLAGVPLLVVGLNKFLHDPDERAMAALEVLIAAAVIIAFLKELRADLHSIRHRDGTHAHSAVGWFDIAAGILLIYEAFHGAHHKPGYLRPQFLSGVTTLCLGIFHGRLQKLKARAAYIKLDEGGFYYRRNRFRKLKLNWADVADITDTSKRVEFRLNDGSTRALSLSTFRNAEEIRHAILEHFEAARRALSDLSTSASTKPRQ